MLCANHLLSAAQSPTSHKTNATEVTRFMEE